MHLYGGQSMVGPLKRVLVCSPEAAGWRSASGPQWRSLGFQHPPDLDAAFRQHDELCGLLVRAGCDLAELPASEGLTPDAVYAHDPSLVADGGAVCLRMGKEARRAEPAAHRRFYETAGIPVAGAIESPESAEAGDLVWLDGRTLLAGRGYRTSRGAARQLAALAGPGVQVVPAPLPHGAGPGSCLHLMSLMSMLDAGTALVDAAWLAVETLELLQERGLSLIEIDASERETLACNVLALGGGRLIALAENPKTNRRLLHAGFEVLEFAGSEIAINGGGGPTCLTRPLYRSPD